MFTALLAPLYNRILDDKIKYLKWLLIIILAGISFSAIKTCKQNEESNRNWEKKERSNLLAQNDKTQELRLELERKDIKLDSLAKKLAERLEIKPRTITEYKYIELENEVRGEVQYELIEVDIPDGTVFEYKFDDCSSVKLEWGSTAKWTLNRKIEIADVSYFKRRPLFGIKRFPRLGRKEYYQHLITNCGDTVVQNKRITFTK